MGAGEGRARSALLYSTTLPTSLATHRSPDESTARPPGPWMPLVMTTSGRGSPVAPGRYALMEPGPVPPYFGGSSPHWRQSTTGQKSQICPGKTEKRRAKHFAPIVAGVISTGAAPLFRARLCRA